MPSKTSQTTEDELQFMKWLETRLEPIAEKTGVHLDFLAPKDATPITATEEEAYTKHILKLHQSGLSSLTCDVLEKLSALKGVSPRISNCWIIWTRCLGFLYALSPRFKTAESTQLVREVTRSALLQPKVSEATELRVIEALVSSPLLNPEQGYPPDDFREVVVGWVSRIWLLAREKLAEYGPDIQEAALGLVTRVLFPYHPEPSPRVAGTWLTGQVLSCFRDGLTHMLHIKKTRNSGNVWVSPQIAHAVQVVDLNAAVDLPFNIGCSWDEIVGGLVAIAQDDALLLEQRACSLELFWHLTSACSLSEQGFLDAVAKHRVVPILIDFMESTPPSSSQVALGFGGDEPLAETMQRSLFALLSQVGLELGLEESNPLALQLIEINFIDRWVRYSLREPADQTPFFVDVMQHYFLILETVSDLKQFVKQAIELIASCKRLSSDPRWTPKRARLWRDAQRKVAEDFEEMELEDEDIPTCAAPACKHAWSVEDGPLKACARCRKVQYCSVSCQRSHWKQHKLACK